MDGENIVPKKTIWNLWEKMRRTLSMLKMHRMGFFKTWVLMGRSTISLARGTRTEPGNMYRKT
jgi:hypothetical protein